MMVKLLEAGARLDDAATLDVLVAPCTNWRQLRKLLNPGFSGRDQTYEEKTRTAWYVAADGEQVRIYTVVGVSLDEAATISAELDAVTQWSTEAFGAAVERALGSKIEHVH